LTKWRGRFPKKWQSHPIQFAPVRRSNKRRKA